MSNTIPVSPASQEVVRAFQDAAYDRDVKRPLPNKNGSNAEAANTRQEVLQELGFHPVRKMTTREALAAEARGYAISDATGTYDERRLQQVDTMLEAEHGPGEFKVLPLPAEDNMQELPNGQKVPVVPELVSVMHRPATEQR